MEKLVSTFENLFIDESARESAVAKRIAHFFLKHKTHYVTQKPFQDREGSLSAEEYDQSKKNLYITEFKGSFFKRCPGAKGVACCNYFVLNLGIQCNMNCSYCYLQSYINTPVMTIYSNIEKALEELSVIADENPNLFYRVGTGETIDSLSMDPLTLYSVELIEFFKKYPKWILEFKTKSASVEQFLQTPHAENVHVTWSINPQAVISHEEHGTASLRERLQAARLCRDHGFKVAFHLDPMVWHPEWKENYLALVDEIAEQFNAEEIPYITLGAIRFQPEQRHMMRERFGMESWVNQGEYFLSDGGKLRYDRDLRTEMFQTVIERFKQHDLKWRVSLCMETPESWVTTMASSPRKIPELKELFVPLPFESVKSAHQEAQSNKNAGNKEQTSLQS